VKRNLEGKGENNVSGIIHSRQPHFDTCGDLCHPRVIYGVFPIRIAKFSQLEGVKI
jgi:hypothetical protein